MLWACTGNHAQMSQNKVAFFVSFRGAKLVRVRAVCGTRPGSQVNLRASGRSSGDRAPNSDLGQGQISRVRPDRRLICAGDSRHPEHRVKEKWSMTETEIKRDRHQRYTYMYRQYPVRAEAPVRGRAASFRRRPCGKRRSNRGRRGCSFDGVEDQWPDEGSCFSSCSHHVTRSPDSA